jgi:hypothetical protein
MTITLRYSNGGPGSSLVINHLPGPLRKRAFKTQLMTNSRARDLLNERVPPPSLLRKGANLNFPSVTLEWLGA